MKQNRSKKISSLLVVSLFGLAPTMSYAGNLAGVAWAAAGVGAMCGAGITAASTKVAAKLTGVGLLTLKTLTIKSETNNKAEVVLKSAAGPLGLSITGAGLLGVAAGVAGTVGLVACSVYSVIKSVKNFKE